MWSDRMGRQHRPGFYLTLIAGAFGLCACEKNLPVSLTGYVEAETIYVAAPQGGWIVEQAVREGDIVASGDVLFQLDADQQAALLAGAQSRVAEAQARAEDIGEGARAPELAVLEAQAEEAKARRAQARSERDRWMPLVESGDASRARGDQVTADYRAAVAREKAATDAIKVARLAGRADARAAADAMVNAAEAGLAEAKWALSQRTVTSKVAGRIETIVSRRGEFVAPGTPAMTLLPEGGLKVRFFVPQAGLAGIKLGDTVWIHADGGPSPLRAHVSFIASQAEFTPPVIFSASARQKLVFLVEARFDEDAPLPRPGMPVDVRLTDIKAASAASVVSGR